MRDDTRREVYFLALYISPDVYELIGHIHFLYYVKCFPRSMIDGMTPIIFRPNSPRILRVLDMIPLKLEVL